MDRFPAASRIVNNQHNLVRIAAETTTGVALTSAPWWPHVIGEINLGLQFVSFLCGAIIGMVGVGKIIQRWRHNRSQGVI